MIKTDRIYHPCAPVFGAQGFFYAAKGAEMETETRIALIGIIVENQEITDELNRILHEFGEYIVGRMGIPYKKQKVCIISVIVMRRTTSSVRFPGNSECWTASV